MISTLPDRGVASRLG